MKNSINEKIRNIRESKKISQEEMALKLNIPRSTYAYREKSGRFTENDISVICDFFGIVKEALQMDEKVFVPFGRVNEDETQLILESPALKLPFHSDDTKQVFVTNDEAENLKRIRALDEEKAKKLFEYLEKLENDGI